MPYYVYLVECSDSTIYCGYTNDLENRIKKHNLGTYGAKYTRGRRPVQLKYFETLDTLSSALKREHQIKQMTKNQKLELINQKLFTI